VIHKTLRAALTAVVLLGVSLPAAAQSTPWEDRVFGGISFGIDSGSADVTDSRTISVYGESGTLSSTSGFDADGIIDFSVGARVWRNMGAAIGYHSKSSTGVAEITGSIPHPQFFDRPRSFSDSVDGIDRDENATHLMIGWMLPVNDNLDVFVYGGPSFYRLSQEVVSDLAIAEQGPPYTSIVVQPTIDVRKKSATGYNIGADATYIVYTTESVRLGIGGFMRFTGATADLRISDNSTVETDLGGFQIGIGARVRF
jgi:hypothetical protein